MITVKVTKKINFGAFEKQLSERKKNFIRDALELVTTDIIRGIDAGVDMTGQPFPELEPSTIKRKGHSKPLIDKGLLHQEYTYERRNQWRANKGLIRVKPRTKGGDTPRDQVAFYLQVEGVKPAKGPRKFFRFFGISKDAERGILEQLDEMVSASLRVI